MNTNRNELYQCLPLDTPFSIHIFPSFYCNFRCSYCLQNLSTEKLKQMNFEKQYMDFELYKKAIDDITSFPKKLRALIFAGHGEPLMHKQIAEMVRYAKEKNIAERIEIVTNGSLLTEELSDKLIEAGLDRLRISLQGVTAEKYKEVSDVKIDFQEFLKRLQYFYNHKTDTEVYIKIIDLALEGEMQKEEFKRIFSKMADITAIEYLIPFVKELDYSEVGSLSGKCKQGNKQTSNICSMPFYMLVLNPNGDVVPCCSTDVPIVFGNIKKQSFSEIWKQENRRKFLCNQLNGFQSIPVCKECSVPAFGLQEGDYLDGHEEELKKIYGKEQ